MMQPVNRQMTGQIIPSTTNINKAILVSGLLLGTGVLLAVRNPKYALGIMTAMFGLSIGASYVAMTTGTTSESATNG